MTAAARYCAWCLLARFMRTLAVTSPCGTTDCAEFNRCWGRHTSQPVAPDPLSRRCDFNTDSDGWITLQQRRDREFNFYRTWAEYKRGFGSGDTFWLGLDNLYRLTKNHKSQLRVEVRFVKREQRIIRYAEYDGVTFGNEAEYYALNYSVYNGRGGLQDGLRLNVGGFCCSDSPDYRCHGKAKDYHTAWWFADRGGPITSDLNSVLVYLHNAMQIVYWVGLADIYSTQIKFRPSMSSVNCDKSCPNGGTCLDAADGTFHCRCASGFRGRRCSSGSPAVECFCFHGGWCRPDASCSCAEGYTGSKCESKDRQRVDQRKGYRFKSWGTIAGLMLVISFLVVLLVLTGFFAYRRLFAADYGHGEHEQLLHDSE